MTGEGVPSFDDLGLVDPLAPPASEPAPGRPQLGLQRRVLFAQGGPFEAQVARSERERLLGLAHREELADHDGMLFVLDEPSHAAFEASGCLVDLDIAFLDELGEVVNVETRPAGSPLPARPRRPALFVLGMASGWFARRGIGPGSRVDGKVLVDERSARGIGPPSGLAAAAS